MNASFYLKTCSDWRLPTLEEAMSLMEPGKREHGLFIEPIFAGAQRWIWTADKASASAAWDVYFNNRNCMSLPCCLLRRRACSTLRTIIGALVLCVLWFFF